MQAAVKAVGGIARPDQARRLAAREQVDTILGPLSWDETGAPQGEFLIGQWQNGKPEIVLPKDAATSQIIGEERRRVTGRLRRPGGAGGAPPGRQPSATRRP